MGRERERRKVSFCTCVLCLPRIASLLQFSPSSSFPSCLAQRMEVSAFRHIWANLSFSFSLSLSPPSLPRPTLPSSCLSAFPRKQHHKPLQASTLAFPLLPFLLYRSSSLALLSPSLSFLLAPLSLLPLIQNPLQVALSTFPRFSRIQAAPASDLRSRFPFLSLFALLSLLSALCAFISGNCPLTLLPTSSENF